MNKKIVLQYVGITTLIATITACEKGRPDFVRPDKKAPTVTIAASKTFIISGGTVAVTCTGRWQQTLRNPEGNRPGRFYQ